MASKLPTAHSAGLEKKAFLFNMFIQTLSKKPSYPNDEAVLLKVVNEPSRQAFAKLTMTAFRKMFLNLTFNFFLWFIKQRPQKKHQVGQ